VKTLLLMALVSFAVQTPVPEHYPGSNSHQKPPDGWFCSHNDPRPAHKCACVRMDHDPNCEGEPLEDNLRCRVKCHPKHCHCPIVCAVDHEVPKP